jgi:hypothetical protein
MTGSSYGPDVIARAIAYPGTDHETAEALKLNRRTVSRWRALHRQNPTHYGTVVSTVVAVTLEDTLAQVRSVRDAALGEMLRRVTDPKTKAGELAAIFREVRDEAALLEGRATSHNLNVNADSEPPLTPEESEALHRFLRSVGGEDLADG